MAAWRECRGSKAGSTCRVLSEVQQQLSRTTLVRLPGALRPACRDSRGEAFAGCVCGARQTEAARRLIVRCRASVLEANIRLSHVQRICIPPVAYTLGIPYYYDSSPSWSRQMLQLPPSYLNRGQGPNKARQARPFLRASRQLHSARNHGSMRTESTD
jgi:hypothetical protein